MNIAEAANITSTVRPPQTSQPARTSQKKAVGSSARFDTGKMVELCRREECSIDVRLSIITTTVLPSIRSHLTEACLWQLCLFRHGTYGGSSTEGRVFHRCTSKQHHDDRTLSAHPSICSHLTEACPWQHCCFRGGVVGWHS